MLVTFEGGEGSGKTTVMKMVEESLRSKGLGVVATREPGGVEISEQIRRILLDSRNTKMDGYTEALLFAAARRQHLVEVIKPHLDTGKIVLCDRYIDSSLAYQGYARGLGFGQVWKINKIVIGEYIPYLTFWLDIEPVIGIQRIMRNSDRHYDRLDAETIQFHSKVREGYRELQKTFPDRFVRVDATLTPEEIKNTVLSYILDSLS